MAKRGRPKGMRNGEAAEIKTVDKCTYCEGTKRHFGGKCGACDGTGLRKVQKALVALYLAKTGHDLRGRKINR